jgi:hypothetical protein
MRSLFAPQTTISPLPAAPLAPPLHRGRGRAGGAARAVLSSASPSWRSLVCAQPGAAVARIIDSSTRLLLRIAHPFPFGTRSSGMDAVAAKS